MNKYNIRAIRKDLDGCIRSGSWKHFRSTFQLAAKQDADLCRAIVECKSHNKNSSSGGGGGGGGLHSHKHGSLLHALLRSKGSNNTDDVSVPVDIVQDIVTAVPRVLYIQEGARKQTPLHICIQENASPTIVECLLENDALYERRSVYIADDNGDTPLLLAVKKKNCATNSNNEAYIELLIRYDTTKQSLLMESRRKKRTPLLYVAMEELRTLNVETDTDVSQELKFMLLETYRALKITTLPPPTKITMVSHNEENREDFCVGDHGNRPPPSLFERRKCSLPGSNLETPVKKLLWMIDGENEHDCDTTATPSSMIFVCLLQVTIACAHLLGKKCASKLLHFILQQGLYNRERIQNTPDPSGNLMLHYACEATQRTFPEEQNWVPSPITKSSSRSCYDNIDSGNDRVGEDESSCFFQHLIQLGPAALKHANTTNGELPLHLALRTPKNWTHIELLLQSYPNAVCHATYRGELPLHLAIIHYNNNASNFDDVLYEVWRRFPEAACVVHGPTHLFPFQLAAACTNQYNRCRRAQQQQQQQRNHQQSSLLLSAEEEANSTIIATTATTTTVGKKKVARKEAKQSKGVTRRNGGVTTLLLHQAADYGSSTAVGVVGCSIDSIYFLLRESPQVLCNFIPS